MKKQIFLLFLFTFQFAFAQKIQDKALLWEISGNGLKNTSYLFGTMHIMCEGDAVLSPNLENALSKTEKILMELDMDDPNMMMNMMQVAMSKDGKTLTSKLGPELAAKVNAVMQAKANMTLAMMDNLNLQTLTMQLGLFALDCPMGMGYDMLITEDAKLKGKEIMGLESVEDQVKVILSQTDKEAIQAISYLVNNFNEAEEQMTKLITLYKEQEIQKLFDLTTESFEDPNYPQGNLEEFLDKRNQIWIPVIEKQIHSTSTFIAVGAAHLPGDQGVINLLKKKGYQVKPVK